MPRDREPCAEFSAELRLLLAAIRSDRAWACEVVGSESVDWESFRLLAIAHHVLSLAYRCVAELPSGAVPAQVLTRLRQQFAANSIRNVSLARELVRIMRGLDESSIESLTFKGPSLAIDAWGDITARQFGDLDLLVRTRDLCRAAEVLTKLGYVSSISARARREAQRFGGFQEFEEVFEHRDGNAQIDLHWRLTPASFPLSPPETELFARAGAVEFDLLIYLCVHAAKHGWSSLGAITDIAALQKRIDNLDYAEILSCASQLGARRAVLAGLLLAAQIADAKIGEKILLEASSDSAVRVIVGRAIGGIGQSIQMRERHAEPVLLPLTSLEGLGARLRFIEGRFLRPTLGDASFVRLPRGAFPLFWLLRPLRLATQYGPAMASSARRRSSEPAR